jgi:hypothetical protein
MRPRGLASLLAGRSPAAIVVFSLRERCPYQEKAPLLKFARHCSGAVTTSCIWSIFAALLPGFRPPEVMARYMFSSAAFVSKIEASADRLLQAPFDPRGNSPCRLRAALRSKRAMPQKVTPNVSPTEQSPVSRCLCNAEHTGCCTHGRPRGSNGRLRCRTFSADAVSADEYPAAPHRGVLSPFHFYLSGTAIIGVIC